MLLRPGDHRSDHSILPDVRHARHAQPARPGSHRGPVNLRNHHELMLDQYDRSYEVRWFPVMRGGGLPCSAIWEGPGKNLNPQFSLPWELL